jgi:hypothetical protein
MNWIAEVKEGDRHRLRFRSLSACKIPWSSLIPGGSRFEKSSGRGAENLRYSFEVRVDLLDSLGLE